MALSRSMVILLTTSPHSGPVELVPRYRFALRSMRLQALSTGGDCSGCTVEGSVGGCTEKGSVVRALLARPLSSVAFQSSSASACRDVLALLLACSPVGACCVCLLVRCIGDRDRSCCWVVSSRGGEIGDSGSGVMDLMILLSGVVGISMLMLGLSCVACACDVSAVGNCDDWVVVGVDCCCCCCDLCCCLLADGVAGDACRGSFAGVVGCGGGVLG